MKFCRGSRRVGIDVTDTLSTSAYVDRLLMMQVNQSLYHLSLLQFSGLQRSSLHHFNAPLPAQA